MLSPNRRGIGRARRGCSGQHQGRQRRTLQRIRSGVNQTVTVQHVRIAPGAQAVIGNVNAKGRRKPMGER